VVFVKKKIMIAPSILSADFGKLNEEIKAVEKFSDLIHVDVMDGVFVPNITFGNAVLKKVKSRKPLDVHLMIVEPEKHVEAFAEAGASIISFHVEATKDPLKTISLIRKNGARPAIAIKPKTRLMEVEEFLDLVDFVLIMTVEPGFPAQQFMSPMLLKIRKLRELKPEIDIEVDGGINESTAKLAVKAGANILVAGSAIFGKRNYQKAIERIRKSAERALESEKKN